MQWLRKGSTILVTLLLIVIGTFSLQSVVAPRAHASSPPPITCFEFSCNGLDPTSTMDSQGKLFCNQDAFAQETVTSASGEIVLWWSANCDANWTQVVAKGTSIADVYMAVCQTKNLTSDHTGCIVARNQPPVSYYTDDAPGRPCLAPIYSSLCTPNIIPAGATTWFTNMVDGFFKIKGDVDFTNGTPLVTHYH